MTYIALSDDHFYYSLWEFRTGHLLRQTIAFSLIKNQFETNLLGRSNGEEEFGLSGFDDRRTNKKKRGDFLTGKILECFIFVK